MANTRGGFVQGAREHFRAFAVVLPPDQHPRRLLVVTNYQMPPEQVEIEQIAPLGLDLSLYGPPKLLKRFDGNLVYVLNYTGAAGG